MVGASLVASPEVVDGEVIVPGMVAEVAALLEFVGPVVVADVDPSESVPDVAGVSSAQAGKTRRHINPNGTALRIVER